MAGRFSRTYSRKRPQPAPPISQFDALVKDGSSVASNQPAATKTAGHIGKWGITSFTSLRAINGGNEDSSKKQQLPGSDSPNYLQQNLPEGMPSVLNHCEAGMSHVVKPVITYKRRKFFKSRGATEEVSAAPPVDSGTTLPTTNFVNTSGSSFNKNANSRSQAESTNDFDALLSSSRGVSSSSTHSIDYNRSNSYSATTNAAADLLVQHANVPQARPSTTLENKSGNSGIRLKIFKSRNTKSTWSEGQYSSKVELPSDDSRGTSISSSGASSPESFEVKDEEKDNVRDTFGHITPAPAKVQEMTGKPRFSVLSHIDQPQSSIDSIFPIPKSPARDNSSICLNTLTNSANINISLDSSAEFGEIIDQSTGLPSSLYGTKDSCSDDMASYASSSIENSSNDALSSRKSYSRKLSSSISSEDETIKKVSMLSDQDDLNSERSSLSDTAVENDHSTNCSSSSSSIISSLERSNNYSRNGTKSYGNKLKPKQNTYSRRRPLENDFPNEKLPLDVRNVSSDRAILKPITEEKYASSNNSVLNDAANVESSINSLPSRVTTKHELFSDDFNEDEIIDRTQLVNSPVLDSAIESNGLFESNFNDKTPQEVESSIIASNASSNISSYSGSLNSIGKAASMPARVGHLRSTSSGLFKDKDAPSTASEMKLPLSLPKKRSIFKSRVVQEDSCKKRATYNHKWHSSTDEKEVDEILSKKASSSQSSGASTDKSPSLFDDFDFDGSSVSSLRRVQSWSAQPSNSVLPSLDSTFEPGSQVTSVKCHKSAKEYYTVIKNVKKLHQLQESGEFQEFNDDVEYFLDALRSSNSASTRCLAALNLAQKCMVPAFRMHLRAHATVCKFFRALQDAHEHPALSLCSAMVMFALSQDRLNMDLDRDSLELMLNLLDSDGGDERSSSGASGGSANGSSQAVNEAMTKIRDLCEQLQKKGHAKHLDLDNLDTGTLAMETLLSLTSKRAGEWFKEELRELGGVDHLVRTVTSSVRRLVSSKVLLGLNSWDSNMAETFSKIERCLKVLENVTHQNESNQDYLMQYQSGVFSTTLMDLFRLCHEQIPVAAAASAHSEAAVAAANSVAEPICVTVSGQKRHAIATSTHKKRDQVVSALQGISSALITSMKVLVNLTHNSRKLGLGSKTFGSQPATYDITLSCLLQLPQYLAVDTKFEVMVLSCCLLLNLVEHSPENRIALMQASEPAQLKPPQDNEKIFSVPSTRNKHSQQNQGAMKALVQIFFSCEASAKEHEAHTDQIIDRDLDQSQRKKEDSKEDELEETVAKLLQKAGRHMEDTLIAAYTALLTGYCIMDDKDCEAAVRKMLPEGHFRTMVAVLKKFLHFMNLTATTSLLRSLAPTQKVVRYMEKLDPPLKPSTSVAERERLEQEKRDRGEDTDDEDLDCSDDQPPSDSLVDAFGF